MLCPATGIHRPAALRPTCSVDVRRAGEGDVLAYKRLRRQKLRAKKRLLEIKLFDEQAAAGG